MFSADIVINFPDDVSGIDFDSLTIEADFVSVAINRNSIMRGESIEVSRPISGEYRDVDGDNELVFWERYSLLDFWSVFVVVLALIAWGVLLAMKRKLKVWIVPTICAAAVVANVGTLFLFSRDGDLVVEDVGMTVSDERDYEPEEVPRQDGVEVIMSGDKSVTISLPFEGSNPEVLSIFNDEGEMLPSKYNPVTGMIEANISGGGIFTLS